MSVTDSHTIGDIQTNAFATLAITAGDFSVTNGTGAGANAGKISVGNGATFTVGGAFANTGGTISLGSTGSTTQLLIATSGATFSGGGHITLGDNSHNSIYGAGTGASLTNVDNTISGAGTIDLYNGSLSLTNDSKGVIDATSATNGLTLYGGFSGKTTITNAGLIEATGAAGLTIYYGAVNNSGGGTILAANGSKVKLTGAHIVGGTLNTAGTGVILAGYNDTLDGTTTILTNSGHFEIDGPFGTIVEGAIANSGTISVNASLYVGTVGATLSGGGVVVLSGSANYYSITNSGKQATLTNIDNTISGTGEIGQPTNGLTLMNQAKGLIEGTGAVVLTLNSTVINTGTIEANGGNLISNATIADSGVIQAIGGGTLTVASGIITAGTSVITANKGSFVNLQGGMIAGGSLTTVSGGVIQSTGNTTLDGTTTAVTNQASVNIQNNTALTVQGAIANTGTITLNSSGNYTFLYVGAAGATLSGGGHVTLSDSPVNHIATSGNGAPATLTNIDNTIAGAGEIGGRAILGWTGLNLINQAKGVIDGKGANTLTLDTGSGSTANAGLIEGTSTGGLTLNGTVVNTGTIEANGGNLTSNATIADSGVIQAIGGGTLTLAGGVITAGTSAIVAGTGSFVNLQGGTIVGGALQASGTGVIQSTGDTTLDGRSTAVNVQTQVSLQNARDLTLEGAIANTATIALVSTGNFTDLFVGSAGATLSGAGQVTMGDNSQNFVTSSNSSSLATLTNIDNTISGSGDIGGHNNGYFGLTLVNQAAGVIEGSAVNNTLNLDTGAGVIANAGLIEGTSAGGLTVNSSIVNTGTIEANGGNLTLNGTLTGAGVVQAVAGGTLIVGAGTIKIGAAPILAATGSFVDLQGGTIYGGVLQSSGTGVFQATGNTILDGLVATVNNQAQVNILNGRALTVEGALNNTDVVALDGAGNQTFLYIAGSSAKLSGGGHVTLSDSGANIVTSSGAFATLTNIDNTISGAGYIGGHNVGYMGLNLINQAAGVIDGSGANSLTLDEGSGSIVNSGTIEGTGAGGVAIDSSLTNYGVIEASGGAVTVNASLAQNGVMQAIGGGTLTIAGGVIKLGSKAIVAATASTVNLQGGTIVGGALETSGTGLIEFTGGAVLSGTALIVNTGGTLAIDNSTLTAQGTITNAGTIAFNGVNSSFGENAELKIAAKTSLVGGGLVTLNATSANIITGAASADTLTNVDNTIVGAGSIGAGQMTLVNQAKGVIDAASGTLTLNTGTNTIANAGLIEAGAGGSANIDSGVANTGTIEANGGSLTISNAKIDDSKGGVIAAADQSTLTLTTADIVGGTLTTAGTGVIQAGDSGSVLDGTTFSVTNAGQIAIGYFQALTIDGAIHNTGTITLNGYAQFGYASTLQIGAAGTNLSGGGTVSLGVVHGGDNVITGAASADTLTNVDNTISGAGAIGNGQMTLVNQAKGVIDGTNGTLTLNTGTNTIANAGLIEATAGGSLSLANQVINGSAGGVIAAADGSNVQLGGTDIIGGTLETAGSGQIQMSGTSTSLDGTTFTVTNAGQISVGYLQALTIDGAIQNTGTITLSGYAQFGYTSTLQIGATGATLSGGGTVSLSNANGGDDFITGVSSTAILTNIGNTIAGVGTISGLTLINRAKGVIDATGTSALTLDTAGHVMTNAGLLEGTGTGGLVIASTTISGLGGMIFAGAGSSVTLQSSVVARGALGTAAGGVIAIGNGSAVTGEGAFANAGTIALQSSAARTALTFDADTTLSGAGQIILTNNTNNIVQGTASSVILTNIDNTISGAGKLGGGKLTIDNGAAGVIDANGSKTLTLSAPSLSNAGLVEATGSGGLIIAATTIANTGTLLAGAGSRVVLQGADVMGGVLATSGSGKIVASTGVNVLDGTVTVLTNQGAVTIGNGATLTIQGAIANTGAIALTGANKATDLVIGAAGATLSGGGSLTLAASASNIVEGASGVATLTNIDNTISGAGLLGGGQMTLVNDAAGVIKGTGGSVALTIDTGAATIVNAGLIQASGAAGTVIKSAVANSGLSAPISALSPSMGRSAGPARPRSMAPRSISPPPSTRTSPSPARRASWNWRIPRPIPAVRSADFLPAASHRWIWATSPSPAA